MTGGRRRRTGRGFFDVVRKIGSFVRPFAKPLASFALPYASRAIGARFGPGAGAASLGIGKALGLGMRRRRKGRGFLSDTLGSLGLGLPRYRAHFSRMV